MSTVTSVHVPELVLDNRVFSFAAFIVPARLPDGGYLEYQPHVRYHRFGIESLNPHGLAGCGRMPTPVRVGSSGEVG
jgi:hypothetical protein